MAAIAAITSAALLYKASLPLLHGKSSFSGQTPFEAAFRVTRRRYVVAGMLPQRSPSFARLPLPSALT
jgi:hypothetical protein